MRAGRFEGIGKVNVVGEFNVIDARVIQVVDNSHWEISARGLTGLRSGGTSGQCRDRITFVVGKYFEDLGGKSIAGDNASLCHGRCLYREDLACDKELLLLLLLGLKGDLRSSLNNILALLQLCRRINKFRIFDTWMREFLHNWDNRCGC